MKTTEFLKENSAIAQEAHEMHQDHEVQMARSQMYNSANAAIEIHKLLKNISEMEGIEGWVASKLTLANQYLESVRDYLKYEQVSQQPEMMEFVGEAADYALDTLLAEARKGDTNFGSTVTHGSWVVYDGSKVKRFKTREGAKAYAEKNGGKVASSEFYADNVQKQVVSEGDFEGWKDWSEKNPGKLNKQHSDMYSRNSHRWGGDEGVPGAKSSRVDTGTGTASRVEKPEGVPKVSKKPMTSFSGGAGRTGGTMDPSAVKSLIPNFESKQTKKSVKENASAGSNQLAVRNEDPLDLSSDYAHYIVVKGNELISTFKKLFAKVNSMPPRQRNQFYSELQDAADQGDLGDIVLQYSKTINKKDLLAIDDVFEEYGVMFHEIAYPDQFDDYTNAWKQYTADVLLSRTKQQPGQTMHEQGVMESAGGMGASSVAISMSGPAHKPTSGVPKKLGNAHKPKKVTVGKGVY